jgi:glycosyltransferase involved in cell wall biosynthesis
VWLGDVQEMNGFLMSLDVFVMISEPAGCPNASLEAMAVGLPVIATDVGGVNEQVVDGVNGRLISRSNLQGLADAIVECSSNLQLRERFGNASRQHVETHFSLNKMAAEYQRVLGLSEPLP